MQINRILIVGLGSIGKRHLRIARQMLPDADIRVLRHQPTVDVPEFANGCFSDSAQAVNFAPEIAVIANPATYHIAIAQTLAEAGVHLMIEKPLSANTHGVQQLLDTCHKRNVILCVGYNLRFLPSLQYYRDCLLSNTIGKVLSVRCEIGQYLPAWRPESDYRLGVTAQQKLGGGALLELSHELDYLRWIFGDVDWVSATLSKQSDLEIDVEDSANMTLGFKSELNKQLIASVNLDFIRHDTTRLCSAIGEKGSLRWNGLTGMVEIFEMGSKNWQMLFSHQHQRDDSYMAEWQQFLASVQGNGSVLVSGKDGFQVLNIIDAARKSSETGCKVQVQNVALVTKASA